MARITRRHLIALTAGGALFGGFRFGHARLARQPKPEGPLSVEAKKLIAKAWDGLDPRRVLDAHVHVMGLGKGGTGCAVGERLQSMSNPVEYFKFTLYLEASGITDVERADQQYVARLAQLLQGEAPHGKLLLLAFDKAHDEDGTPLEADTEFFTPNEYVARLARRNPDYFAFCASVHPYRKDAVEALRKAVLDGAVAVKWLPNAMNIDPSSPRCDAFYEAMARLQLPLITHSGEEKAVHSEERQKLGNPLLLRRALEHGVKVVVAHCASLGQNPDLDAEGTPLADNFDLFLRLMNEPKWEGRLFGEISALTLFNRLGRPLTTMLREEKWHHRLINASDYPLPGINALVQTSAIVSAGLITEDERALLNEIDRHDPLLFDFVLKRTLRLKDGARTFRFPDEVFQWRLDLMPLLQFPVEGR